MQRPLAQRGRGLGDTGEDCVIVDGDDTVLGLAGIMGGASSEISATTTEVLLEAAYFNPMSVARSSKRHGLRSEASNRFERGVDPELGLRAAADSSPSSPRVAQTCSGWPTRSTSAARRPPCRRFPSSKVTSSGCSGYRSGSTRRQRYCAG